MIYDFLERILQTAVLFSSISLIYSELKRDKEPLMLDPYTLEIYDPEDVAKLNAEHMYAFACPVETFHQQRVIDHVSHRYESLFIKKYIQLKAQDENPIKCEDSFELSLVYRPSTEFIEFGYEVYYEKWTYPKDFKKAKMRDFGMVTEVGRAIQRINRNIENAILNPEYRRNVELNRWRMLWVPKISIKFEARHWILKSMQYLIHPIKEEQLQVKCEHYYIGHEVYDSKTKIDDLYKADNQRKHFAEVQLQETWGSPCTPDYQCVRKYNLIMPYHYKAYPSDEISCSDLTSVPLWHNIPEELIDQLEIFLIAISQVTGNQFEIQSGVHEILALPLTTNKQQSMYLDRKKKRVPIPKSIYKIVQYKSHDCDEKQDLCWFSMVIVVHNHHQMEIADTDKLCPKDKCFELGFDRIQYLNTTDEPRTRTKHDNVYCCVFRDELLNKVGFKKGKKTTEDLNLAHFPHYNKDSKKLEYVQDIREKFEAKLDDLMKKFKSKDFQVHNPVTSSPEK